MTPSGHNWVQGQGAGPRLTDKDDEEDKFDAMGNSKSSLLPHMKTALTQLPEIEGGKKQKKLTSSELRKKKKDRMVCHLSSPPDRMSLLTPLKGKEKTRRGGLQRRRVRSHRSTLAREPLFRRLFSVSHHFFLGPSPYPRHLTSDQYALCWRLGTKIGHRQSDMALHCQVDTTVEAHCSSMLQSHIVLTLQSLVQCSDVPIEVLCVPVLAKAYVCVGGS